MPFVVLFDLVLIVYLSCFRNASCGWGFRVIVLFAFVGVYTLFFGLECCLLWGIVVD